MKRCSKCRVEKPESEFYVRKVYRGQTNVPRDNCKECDKVAANAYNHENRDERNAYASKKRAENPELLRQRTRAWRSTDEGRKRCAEYAAERYNEIYKYDPDYRIRASLRSRIWNSVTAQSGTKDLSTLELTMCTTDQLHDWIETQFLPGMTWENYGEWEIDHVKPCVSFNLRLLSQQQECFHFTNLQPLWASDNRKKGARA